MATEMKSQNTNCNAVTTSKSGATGVKRFFKFSVDSTWSNPYINKGFMYIDSKGNIEFNCDIARRAYVERKDLWDFLKKEFSQCEYTYKNVCISFYGKQRRIVRVGRTVIDCSMYDKICLPKSCFLPDLNLAMILLIIFDELNPYGFDKSYWFKDKTIEEIYEFFAEKFNSFRVKSLLRRTTLPSFCLDRIKTVEDFNHWKSVKAECENRRLQANSGYALPSRALKTIFFKEGWTEEIPLAPNMLGCHSTSECNRAIKLMNGEPFSVWLSKSRDFCYFRRKSDGKEVCLYPYGYKFFEKMEWLKK